ncbi:hypothetical protein Pla52nx_003157 [Stieleria varia]
MERKHELKKQCQHQTLSVIHAGVYFVGIWLLSAASNVALAGVPLTQP